MAYCANEHIWPTATAKSSPHHPAVQRCFSTVFDQKIYTPSCGAHRTLTPAGWRRHDMQMPLRLTIAMLMLDIETAWTLNALLTRSSRYRKCSKRRISGHSAQATSRLRIEGTTKCSRIVRGFNFGNDTGFAAELSLRHSGWGNWRARPAQARTPKSVEPLQNIPVVYLRQD
jgi:hypothetical protein